MKITGTIDTKSWFYKNCKTQRGKKAKCCLCCPFRKGIEDAESKQTKMFTSIRALKKAIHQHLLENKSHVFTDCSKPKSSLLGVKCSICDKSFLIGLSSACRELGLEYDCGIFREARKLSGT